MLIQMKSVSVKFAHNKNVETIYLPSCGDIAAAPVVAASAEQLSLLLLPLLPAAVTRQNLGPPSSLGTRLITFLAGADLSLPGLTLSVLLDLTAPPVVVKLGMLGAL